LFSFAGGGWRGGDCGISGLALSAASRVSGTEASDSDLPSVELGGLVRELAWLGRRSGWLLVAEAEDDVDSEGAWYGLPPANSWARLIVGRPGVLGRITPLRGVSLALLGFLASSASSGLEFVEGAGAVGVRVKGAKLSFGRGKVSARLGVPGLSNELRAVLKGEPSPPYPLSAGAFGLPRMPLMFEAEVLGRSSGPLRPLVEGRRGSKGPGVMAFTLSAQLVVGFFASGVDSTGVSGLASSRPP